MQLKRVLLFIIPFLLSAQEIGPEALPKDVLVSILVLQRDLIAKYREADQYCGSKHKIFDLKLLACIEVPKEEKK